LDNFGSLLCIYVTFILHDMQIVIDTCCATFAEVQKRGKDFWSEFELYLADLLVGLVVNVALVGMLAPYARIGKPSISSGFLGRMQKGYAALPSRFLIIPLTWHCFPMSIFLYLMCICSQ